MNQFEQMIVRCKEIGDLGLMPEIEAIVIGGSASFDQLDIHSDLDLFILIDSCWDISILQSRIKQLAALLGSYTLFHGPQLLEGFGYSFLALYEPLLVGQFLVNDKNTLRPNPMQAQHTPIIFDRTGYYTQYLNERKSMKIDEIKLFDSTFAFFWFRVMRVWKDIQRGHIWLAIRHLSDVRDQLFVLQRLIANIPPPGLNFLWPSKSAEKELDESINLAFQKTLCTYSADSATKALIYCMEWFMNDSVYFAENAGIDITKRMQEAQKLYDHCREDLQYNKKFV